MAYRLGAGLHLFRANSPTPPRGGLMLIGEDGFDGMGDVNLFTHEVMRECMNRGYQGVIFDPESRPTPAMARIISALSDQLGRRKMSFYLPESYSNYSASARILIPSAISGGTLQRRLEDVVERYGAKRVVLCLDRSAEDFHLPAPQGAGRPLTRDELRRQIGRAHV